MERKPARHESSLVVVVFLGLAFLTLGLIVGSFPAGVYAVFHGGLSNQLSYGSYVQTFLFIGPVAAILPFTVPIGGVFLLVLAVYAGMFAYGAAQQKRPAAAMRDAFATGVGALMESPLFVILVAIGFLGFTGTFITAVSVSALGSVGNPFANFDPLLEFGSLALAPLREELGFRVVLIGLFALVLSVGRSPREALRALWRPSAVFEGAAVGGAAGVIIWAATVGSAVTFGLCHVNCGGTGGWSWAKLPDAVWGGLVLGYLYVRYGFHVAVLAHWGVDYFGSAYSFFGQSAFGISVNATNEYVGQTLVDYDLVLLFGVASFVLVAYLAIKKYLLTDRGSGEGLIDKGPETGPPLAT
ncbi:MAG: CPBP family intramembrane metalloprotease [Nitrososphaerota archaeon]|nr:CPBP family glutamic-type intramembrane protease [Nitrososphaerota archaeon]MDG6912868.1 CPBP family intramembrane metalloprotease [Nitrososphaerota archaeon]MDG6937162.1 CPBP family intramembrane metalloprotease [Nitrososphaerota archaeon]MDG6961824.1 CPBP family intramembrane metalloprotease [Nitrososphaerota archaeon]MDG6962485.1 CPBP family intramembrane metalloprotease [Nitrososphaerota archaeon]